MVGLTVLSPFAYLRTKTQKVEFDDAFGTVLIQYDGLKPYHADLRYDRIRDVVVRQDCWQMCCCIDQVDVSLTNPTCIDQSPTILAPMDSNQLYIDLITRRNFVAGKELQNG